MSTSHAAGSRVRRGTRWQALQVAGYIRQLGVDVAVGHSWHTEPVLRKRLEVGEGALCRVPHLPVFHRRVRAVNTLVTLLALHGVALAPVTDSEVVKLESLVLQCVWGATRLSRAKEMVLSLLAPGHRISPVMHLRYKSMAWLAHLPRCPGSPRSSCKRSGNASPSLGQTALLARWSTSCRPWAATLGRAGGAGKCRGRHSRCTLCVNPCL